MRRRDWEVKLEKELKNRLFKPRLQRILALAQRKEPKPISGKAKRRLIRDVRKIAEEPLREKYKDELKKLARKSFELGSGGAKETKKAIKDKTEKYEKKINKKLRRLIYALWKDMNECLYVGQTKRGLNEIISKKNDLYKESTGLKLYMPRSKTQLDKYEGIAYHVLAPKGKRKPKYNKVQSKNFKKRCPICRRIKRIEREINRAFVLKTRKKREKRKRAR